MVNSNWIAYKCKSGQTIFLYNKVTGVHKWPPGFNDVSSEDRIIYGQPVEVKEVHSITTQTNDYGCTNGCTSIYITGDLVHEMLPQLQPSVVVDSQHNLQQVHDLAKNLEDDVELNKVKHDAEITINQDENDDNGIDNNDGCAAEVSKHNEDSYALANILEEIKFPTIDSLASDISLECTLCKKTFRHKGHWIRHIKAHENHKCTVCGKLFKSRKLYKRHRLVHTKEKPFECSYCKKKFALNGNLKVHIRKHTREKPYGCSFCNEQFRYRQKLKAHIKASHEGQNSVSKDAGPVHKTGVTVANQSVEKADDLYVDIVTDLVDETTTQPQPGVAVYSQPHDVVKAIERHITNTDSVCEALPQQKPSVSIEIQSKRDAEKAIDCTSRNVRNTNPLCDTLPQPKPNVSIDSQSKHDGERANDSTSMDVVTDSVHETLPQPQPSVTIKHLPKQNGAKANGSTSKDHDTDHVHATLPQLQPVIIVDTQLKQEQADDLNKGIEQDKHEAKEHNGWNSIGIDNSSTKYVNSRREHTNKSSIQNLVESIDESCAHQPCQNALKCLSFSEQCKYHSQLDEHQQAYEDKKSEDSQRKETLKQTNNTPRLEAEKANISNPRGRIYKCSPCNKNFKHLGHFLRHLKVREGRNSYKCCHCRAMFKHRVAFDQHLKTHTWNGKVFYKCFDCGKTFTTQRHRQRHRLVHTQEKRFECSYCKKKFALNHNLKVHIRMHTKEKPFACRYCEKKYTYSQDLNKHLRRHYIESLSECCHCKAVSAKKS